MYYQRRLKKDNVTSTLKQGHNLESIMTYILIGKPSNWSKLLGQLQNMASNFKQRITLLLRYKADKSTRAFYRNIKIPV